MSDSQNQMVDAREFLEGEIPHHFKVIHAKDQSYRDLSTVIVIPTRGQISTKVVSSLISLIPPQNQKRGMYLVENAEVGRAYEKALEGIMRDEELSKFKYVLTIEDDNIVPPMAHMMLLQSITKYKFAAMSGLYFAKGEFGFPMAFGDPNKFRDEGVFDCIPRDMADAVRNNEVMEVNAIPMGCAIWEMAAFKKLKELKPEAPLFQTWQQHNGDDCGGYAGQTQDIFICERIRRELGGRIGVDCRVKVGHYDAKTGVTW